MEICMAERKKCVCAKWMSRCEIINILKKKTQQTSKVHITLFWVVKREILYIYSKISEWLNRIIWGTSVDYKNRFRSRCMILLWGRREKDDSPPPPTHLYNSVLFIIKLSDSWYSSNHDLDCPLPLSLEYNKSHALSKHTPWGFTLWHHISSQYTNAKYCSPIKSRCYRYVSVQTFLKITNQK